MKHFREEKPSIWDQQLHQKRQGWWRTAAFVAGTLAIWSAYFVWREPAPMLGLSHIENLGRETPQVALTIDDAPHPLSTPLLLASLERADVKATFFTVGEGLKLYPELAHRIATSGHKFANHSQPHHNLTTVPPADFAQHIDEGFAAIKRAETEAGVQAQTRLFRPPGGGLNRAAMKYLHQKNYTLAWWTNNVGDWTSPPAWKIADGVKANLRAGDIILLHDGGTGTPQAIPAIVKEARARGLEFVVMPEASH